MLILDEIVAIRDIGRRFYISLNAVYVSMYFSSVVSVAISITQVFNGPMKLLRIVCLHWS